MEINLKRNINSSEMLCIQPYNRNGNTLPLLKIVPKGGDEDKMDKKDLVLMPKEARDDYSYTMNMLQDRRSLRKQISSEVFRHLQARYEVEDKLRLLSGREKLRDKKEIKAREKEGRKAIKKAEKEKQKGDTPGCSSCFSSKKSRPSIEISEVFLEKVKLIETDLMNLNDYVKCLKAEIGEPLDLSQYVCLICRINDIRCSVRELIDPVFNQLGETLEDLTENKGAGDSSNLETLDKKQSEPLLPYDTPKSIVLESEKNLYEIKISKKPETEILKTEKGTKVQVIASQEMLFSIESIPKNQNTENAPIKPPRSKRDQKENSKIKNSQESIKSNNKFTSEEDLKSICSSRASVINNEKKLPDIKVGCDENATSTKTSATSTTSKSSKSSKTPIKDVKTKKVRIADEASNNMKNLNNKNSNENYKDLCLKCYGEEVPVVKENLLGEIEKIVGQRKGTIFLKFTVLENELVHILISATDNNNLGCLYSTEKATIEAKKSKHFNKYVTICVTRSSTFLHEIKNLVNFAFELVDR